jgi:hypothetical protein
VPQARERKADLVLYVWSQWSQSAGFAVAGAAWEVLAFSHRDKLPALSSSAGTIDFRDLHQYMRTRDVQTDNQPQHRARAHKRPDQIKSLEGVGATSKVS